MSARPIEHVVIVGGGTAGWMTAASLIQRLAPRRCQVTLIESSEIGTIGVGEATVPAIRAYFQSLGLDVADLMAKTNATFKLGIEFKDWRHDGHRFFHPFARYGIQAGPVDFHQLHRKLAEAGEDHPLDAYCLGTEMAYAGRFAPADPEPRADFQVYDWAVHFDASLFARYLRGLAEASGVQRIDARITEVRQNPESGFVTGVVLDNGAEVAGDLFVDCSGFRSLLLQKTLGVGFRDWSHWLPCDRAVALPCQHKDANDLAPVTRSTAQKAGWTWRIPLQHRIGNGYVYSSAHISDDEAEATLRGQLDGEALAGPNLVRFKAGHTERFWEKNVVAIGLSSGFLEPLESTSITLIQAGISKLLNLFPDMAFDPATAAEYNRLAVIEFERIRDFIILHYWANGRDGELWRQCRETPLPDTLLAKIEAYKARGAFVRYDGESFFDPSWLCMYDGFGIVPRAYDPFADSFALDDLKALAANIRADVKAMAQDASSHADYIRQYCPAAV